MSDGMKGPTKRTGVSDNRRATANPHEAPICMPLTGASWDDEDHATSRVAQPYGGYVLAGSRLDVK